MGKYTKKESRELKNKISHTKREKNYILTEKKFENLVLNAEYLLGSTDVARIIRIIEKMELSLEEAINTRFYNLPAYYIDLANLQYKVTYNSDQDIKEKIEYYYKKAIILKPNSQNARTGLVQYYARNNKFTSSLIYLFEIENELLINNFLDVFASNGNVLTNTESNYEALKIIEKAYIKKNSNNTILLQLYCSLGDLFNAEVEYDRLIHTMQTKVNENLNETQLALTINLLLWISYFEETSYSTENRNRFIRKVIEQGEKSIKQFDQHYHIFTTNKCLSLLIMEEYDEVVNVLSEKVITYPNNTDFSNLAFAYFSLSQFEKSKMFALKAFSTQVDEQILNLLVQLYFIEKDYTKSLEYSLQSLAYIEKQTEGKQSFIDNNGINVTSMRVGSYGKEKADKFQKTLIQVFTVNGYYSPALQIIEERIKNNPSDMDYSILKVITEKLVIDETESDKKINELKVKYTHIQSELDKKIKIQNKMKEFLSSFVSLQNINDNIKIDDNELSIFLTNVQHRLKKLINNKYNPTLNEKIQVLKKTFRKSFNRLNNLSVEQLSIAEALFEEFDYTPLDYGMLAVIYGKVMEIELQKLLKSRGYTHTYKIIPGGKKLEKINWDKGVTIAQCRDLLREKPIEELTHIEEMIEEVRKARNSSAHTGSCDLKTISKVRDYLYEQKWLEKLNEQL